MHVPGNHPWGIWSQTQCCPLCGSECMLMLRLLEGVRSPARIEPYALVQLAFLNGLLYAEQHANVS